MSISAHIHPRSFEAEQAPSGTAWIYIDAGGGSSAVIHVSTPEQADELIRAAVELKRLIQGYSDHTGGFTALTTPPAHRADESISMTRDAMADAMAEQHKKEWGP